MNCVSRVVENYLLTRDISKEWSQQIEFRIGCFVEWLGNDPPFHSLDCNMANRWLMELQQSSGLAPHTIHGYRTALHAVWKFAYEESFTEIPPLRLRKIKRPPLLVEAYTHEQLRMLRITALNLPRNIEGTKIPRAVWWGAYIPAAYSTGLRRGCLLSLQHRHIDNDGVCVVYAKKTGKLTARRLASYAIDGIAEIATYINSPLAFPRGSADHAFGEDFKQIVLRAGLPEHSTSKWMRRSAISYAEAELAGQGKELGGHSDERVTNRSYRDMRIAPPPIVEPPAVEW